jgi:hypothetical protein
MPCGKQPLALGALEPRLVARGLAPASLDIRHVPDAGADPRQAGGPERRGLAHLGNEHGCAEDVGLELHQPPVRDRAAVGAKLGHRLARGGLLGADRIDRLVGDRLEGRAREVAAVGSPCEAHDRAAGVRIPVRRAEPGQRWDEVDAVVRAEVLRELLGLRGRVDDAEPVAQPLDRGPGDEDRRLERVVGVFAQPPGDRGQEAFGGLGGLRPRVEQDEASGAVGALRHPGAVAGLPEERRLLVARDAGDRDVAAELGRRAIGFGRARDLRQRPWVDSEQPAEVGVPGEAVDVEQHGARGVREVGHVPPGELEDEPRVDRPEYGAARLRHVLQQPLDLRRGEVGIDDEPRPRANERLVARLAQLVAPSSRSPVLPDERVVNGLARSGVPRDDGLALVGDPDRGEIGPADPGVG